MQIKLSILVSCMALLHPFILQAQSPGRKVSVKKIYGTPELHAAMKQCETDYKQRLGDATDGSRAYIDGPNTILYTTYEKGWVIGYKDKAYPVTGYILDKFLKTGGIAYNGYPVELETNRRLEKTNLNYQAFSKRCFWGCGINIINIERRFYEYLKNPARGDGYKAINNLNQCPLGDEKSIANSRGKLLELTSMVLCAAPTGTPVSLSTSDIIYRAWKKLGYTNSKLGCPFAWTNTPNSVMSANNTSTKYYTRQLNFENGYISFYLGGPNDKVNVVYRIKGAPYHFLDIQ